MPDTLKDSVLQALQENEDDYLSGEKLSEKMGVSRAAVWKAIKKLRSEGFPIEAVSNRGYILMKDAHQISEEEIRRCLPAKYRKNGLYVYDITESTNTLARQLAAGDGLPDRDLQSADVSGSVVVARQQTGGRGRLGRGFYSPREGLYFSIIVRPDFDLSRSVLVTVAAASAVAEAIEVICGEETQIKWVNDIYIKGKKVCGILTEGITNFETGQIDHLVIGIGINTTTEGFPRELQEIAGAVGGEYSRSALVAGVISRTLDYLEHIEERSFMESYRKRSMLIGKEIQVFRGTYREDPKKEMDGRPARALGIDDNGGLQVIFSDGAKATLTTGEVSVRPR